MTRYDKRFEPDSPSGLSAGDFHLLLSVKILWALLYSAVAKGITHKNYNVDASTARI